MDDQIFSIRFIVSLYSCLKFNRFFGNYFFGFQLSTNFYLALCKCVYLDYVKDYGFQLSTNLVVWVFLFFQKLVL